MRISVIAVGRRMPGWVSAAVDDYGARMPADSRPVFTEIALGRRTRDADATRAIAEEGARMLARIPDGAHVVALDERGSGWTTTDLARRLSSWREQGRPVALLVGGPDGLAGPCLDRADQRWSLSPLTLPHALVRVVLAEQLYRAWSILTNHPYHRA